MRRILTLSLALVLAAALLTGCTGRRNDSDTTGDTDASILPEVPTDSPTNEPMDTTEDKHNGSVSTDPDGSIGDTEHSGSTGDSTEHNGDQSGEPTETGEVSRSRRIRSR